MQVEPDQAAESKTDQRQNRIAQQTPLAAGLLSDHRKLPEAGEVDAHECEKRAEIQQFACVFVRTADVVKHHGAKKCESANQQDVIGRSAAAGLEIAKKLSRQNAIAPHAEEQSRRPQCAGQST